jgi:hypothetical protein
VIYLDLGWESHVDFIVAAPDSPQAVSKCNTTSKIVPGPWKLWIVQEAMDSRKLGFARRANDTYDETTLEQ